MSVKDYPNNSVLIACPHCQKKGIYILGSLLYDGGRLVICEKKYGGCGKAFYIDYKVIVEARAEKLLELNNLEAQSSKRYAKE